MVNSYLIKEERLSIGRKTVSSINGAGKIDIHMQKDETRPLSFTIHKDKLKMDERSKCETRFHQNPRGEHSNTFLNLAAVTSCKIPRNKPKQGGKDRNQKHYRTLRKEIEEDTKSWKYIPCSWIGRINIVKMSCYPGQCTRLMQSLSKYHGLFRRVRTNYFKICVESEKTPNSQGNFK